MDFIPGEIMADLGVYTVNGTLLWKFYHFRSATFSLRLVDYVLADDLS